MGLLFQEHPKAQPGGLFLFLPFFGEARGSNLQPLVYKHCTTEASYITDILSACNMQSRNPKVAPVAERLRALSLNHSNISPLCPVWVRAPHWPHVRQAKFCLRVCQVFFLGVLPFSPHLPIGPSHMS